MAEIWNLFALSCKIVACFNWFSLLGFLRNFCRHIILYIISAVIFLYLSESKVRRKEDCEERLELLEVSKIIHDIIILQSKKLHPMMS